LSWGSALANNGDALRRSVDPAVATRKDWCVQQETDLPG
jgi:hypothetical protein